MPHSILKDDKTIFRLILLIIISSTFISKENLGTFLMSFPLMVLILFQ